MSDFLPMAGFDLQTSGATKKAPKAATSSMMPVDGNGPTGFEALLAGFTGAAAPQALPIVVSNAQPTLNSDTGIVAAQSGTNSTLSVPIQSDGLLTITLPPSLGPQTSAQNAAILQLGSEATPIAPNLDTPSPTAMSKLMGDVDTPALTTASNPQAMAANFNLDELLQTPAPQLVGEVTPNLVMPAPVKAFGPLTLAANASGTAQAPTGNTNGAPAASMTTQVTAELAFKPVEDVTSGSSSKANMTATANVVSGTIVAPVSTPQDATLAIKVSSPILVGVQASIAGSALPQPNFIAPQTQGQESTLAQMTAGGAVLSAPHAVSGQAIVTPAVTPQSAAPNSTSAAQNNTATLTPAVTTPPSATLIAVPTGPAPKSAMTSQTKVSLEGESGDVELPLSAVTAAHKDAMSVTAPSPTGTTSAPMTGIEAALVNARAVIKAPELEKVSSETDPTAPVSNLGMDSLMGSGGGIESPVTAPTSDAPARTQPSLPPHTIPMMAATMMRRLENGVRQFSMRLDPPELGKVEVKLTVENDKKTRAVISVDRPEALADLTKSTRDLIQALRDAGLDIEDNGLSFNLNGGSNNQNQHARDQHPTRQTFGSSDVVADVPAIPAIQTNRPSQDGEFQTWRRTRVALTI
jgi:flagellar hook-length control protein FliK